MWGTLGESIHSDRHGGAAIGLSHLSMSHYPLLGTVKVLILDSSKANDAFCQLTGNIEKAFLKLQIMIQVRKITRIKPIKIEVYCVSSIFGGCSRISIYCQEQVYDSFLL